jgi:hypothetical protein
MSEYIKKWAPLLGIVIWITGCGGYPRPDRELVSAESAIRGAQEVGARNLPRSSLFLKLAERQVEKARTLMNDGYNERAALVLKRAQSDADLALAVAREETATTEAAESAKLLADLKAKLKQ